VASAQVAVAKRGPLGVTALAAGSLVLVTGAALLVQPLVPKRSNTSAIDMASTLAATALAAMTELSPAVVQDAGIIAPEEAPEERVEPNRRPVAHVRAPSPRSALAPARADATPAAMSAPPPAVNDAVPADSLSASLPRPREALMPTPVPEPPLPDAVRASRTDEARAESSSSPTDRDIDRPRPAPLPASRGNGARSEDTSDLAASAGITEALKDLELAYGRRDATLAKAVWPTVNERALARAFEGLRSQSVTFDRCKMDVAGAAGEVECHGVTTYVTRVGSQDRRTESRQWKFRVKKADAGWLIVSAAAR
jgi:hypothetical protein